MSAIWNSAGGLVGDDGDQNFVALDEPLLFGALDGKDADEFFLYHEGNGDLTFRVGEAR